MARPAFPAHHHPLFRNRSPEVSRVEAFSDAVFGFAGWVYFAIPLPLFMIGSRFAARRSRRAAEQADPGAAPSP